MSLARIQLYDEENFMVDQPVIDYNFTKELACVGNNGSGDTTGTVEFCENNNCQKNAPMHCLYKPNEILYIIAKGHHIPIRAYGSMVIDTYPFNEKLKQCEKCSVKCSVEGAHYVVSEETRTLEMCSGSICEKISKPKTSGIISFPEDIMTQNHSFEMTVWIEGRAAVYKEKCPAVEACLFVTCMFCWQILEHPQCASKWALGGWIGALYLTVIVLLTLCKFLSLVSVIIKGIISVFSALLGCWMQIISWVFKRKPRKSSRLIRRRRKNTTAIELENLLPLVIFYVPKC